MDPIEYYKEAVFEKFADFEGRSRRSEFWSFYLVHMLIIIGLAMVGPRINIGFYLFTLILYSILSIIPALAVTVRRLHDTDRSGWWYLISFIPFIGGIIMIVFLVTEGTPGPNLYGEDPKDDDYYLEENY